MAFRKRFSAWRGRARGYASRGYSRGRKMYRAGGGSVIFAGAGVAAGVFAPRIIPYQDMIMMGLAVLPGVLPVGRTVPWQVRRFASGYVLGGMMKAVVPQLGGAGFGGSAGNEV